MPPLNEVIENELEKLSGNFPNSQVRRMRRPTPAAPRFVHPRPSEQHPEPVTLPGFSAERDGRKVNVDFATWMDEGVVMTIFVSGTSPVYLSLSLAHGQLHAFSHRSVSTAEPGVHPALEEKFVLECVALAGAGRILSDPEVERSIEGLGTFERLTLDPRFVKLSRLIAAESPMTADGLNSDIAALVQLIQRVESLSQANASPDGRATRA